MTHPTTPPAIGDWAVICPECAKEFKCEVVNRERDIPK